MCLKDVPNALTKLIKNWITRSCMRRFMGSLRLRRRIYSISSRKMSIQTLQNTSVIIVGVKTLFWKSLPVCLRPGGKHLLTILRSSIVQITKMEFCTKSVNLITQIWWMTLFQVVSTQVNIQTEIIMLTLSPSWKMRSPRNNRVEEAHWRCSGHSLKL